MSAETEIQNLRDRVTEGLPEFSSMVDQEKFELFMENYSRFPLEKFEEFLKPYKL